jgi:hypothetical protein
MKLKFIVEMDDRMHCEFLKIIFKTMDRYCIKEEFYKFPCTGYLNDRPDWCPLKLISEESILKTLDDIDAIIKEGEGK